jgi:hypothetical protein
MKLQPYCKKSRTKILECSFEVHLASNSTEMSFIVAHELKKHMCFEVTC